MSNERHELGEFVRDIHGNSNLSMNPARELANDLYNLGYRKPRTVTTAAELDELPVGSVVLDGWGTAYQKEADDDGDTYWSCFEGIIYHFKTFHGPVTLLHEGATA